jgi:DNA-binding CsgD family transcriptional regulator
MSSARMPHAEGCERRSPFSSPTLSSSLSGATPIRSDSNTPCSTSRSSARPRRFGYFPRPTKTALPSEPLSLAEIVSARGYPARVGAVVERVAAVGSPTALLSLLLEGIAALGAECGVFMNFVVHEGSVTSCRFMLACEPGWCQRYLEAQLVAEDPWLAYAAHHNEPIVASALHGVQLRSQQVIELAARSGFGSAALVPAHSGAGHSRISLLCLGSSQPGFFEGAGFRRFRLGARLLAAELHDWWLERARRELMAKARITTSELELLRRERAGQSSKQIASALGVSEMSINSKFQRMNAKLGVSSRRLAVCVASECGLLLD